MNAKAVTTGKSAKKLVAVAATRSAMRLSEASYVEIAKALRAAKQNVEAGTVAYYGTIALGRRLPKGEATEVRMAKIRSIIRDLDAAEASTAQAKLTGSVQGLDKGGTADLLLKSIVTAALESQKVQLLEGMRKLLMAQEERFQQRLARQDKLLSALCTEWGVQMPEMDRPATMPVIEPGGQIVRLPRILVYGMQANQKQPLYDLINSWGLKDVADVDMGYSTDRPASLKRGYDVVITNRHFLNIDDVRDIRSHGAKIVEAKGALSEIARHLQVEMLAMAIEAEKKKKAQS